jgi:hypothetical protein
MPRATRNSVRLDEVKENFEAIRIEKTPKKRITKRKSPKDDDETSEGSSSPPKSSRSNSLSPFRNEFAEKLQMSAGKETKFRSARRALADNSEFRLPGREKEVS